MRRLLAVGLIAAAAGGCDFFTPPCTKVARAVCDVGQEGDTCAFVLDRSRDDRLSQDICTDILPSALALKKEPSSGTAKADWLESRQKLATLGFKADALRGRIDDKLKRAGGVAGHLLEKFEENSNEAEKRTTEGAEKALEGAR